MCGLLFGPAQLLRLCLWRPQAFLAFVFSPELPWQEKWDVPRRPLLHLWGVGWRAGSHHH